MLHLVIYVPIVLHIIAIINHFITDKKTCESRALPSSGSSSRATSHAPSLIDDPQAGPETKTMAKTTATKKGPSEYSLMQEANITKNKELLASLGLGNSGGIFGDSSSSKKQKKKKK
jgi:hypothetical protein